MVGTSPSNAGGHGFDHCLGGTKIPCALGSKNIKQRQYCNKFNKHFKNGPHQKTFKEKRARVGLFSVSLIWGHVDHPPPQTQAINTINALVCLFVDTHFYLFIWVLFSFAWSCGLQDLSSMTRVGTCALAVKAWRLSY